MYEFILEFVKEGLQSVGELEVLVKAAKKAEARLAEHFCEDPTKFKPEECFLLLADFYAKVNQAIVVSKLFSLIYPIFPFFHKQFHEILTILHQTNEKEMVDNAYGSSSQPF